MVHVHAMGRDLICSEDQCVLARNKKEEGPPVWIAAKSLTKKHVVAIPRDSIANPPEFPLLPSSLGIYSPLLGRMGRLVKRDTPVPASSISGPYVPDDMTPSSPQLTGIIQRIPLCSSKEIAINLTRFTRKCVTSSSDKLSSDISRALLRSSLRTLCEASFYPFNDTPRSRAIIRLAALINGRAGINTYVDVQRIENIVLKPKQQQSPVSGSENNGNQDVLGNETISLENTGFPDTSSDEDSSEDDETLAHINFSDSNDGLKDGKSRYYFKQLKVDNSPDGPDSKIFKIPTVFKDTNSFVRMWVLCDDISVLYHIRSDIAALSYGVPKMEQLNIDGNNGPFVIVHLPTDVALILIGLGFVTLLSLKKGNLQSSARYGKVGENCYLPTGKISIPPFILCRVSPAVASTFVRGLLGSRMDYAYSGSDAAFLPPVALGGSPRIRGAIGCLMARVGVAASFSKARIRSIVKYPSSDPSENAKLSDKEIASSGTQANSTNTVETSRNNTSVSAQDNKLSSIPSSTQARNGNINNGNSGTIGNNSNSVEPLFLTLPTGLDTIIYISDKDDNNRIMSARQSVKSMSLNAVTPPYFCAISTWYSDKIGFLNPAPDSFLKYVRSNNLLGESEEKELDKKPKSITVAELSLALPGMLGYPLRLLGSNQTSNDNTEGDYSQNGVIPPPSYSIPNSLSSISVSTRRIYDTLRSGLKFDGSVESGFLTLLQSPVGFVSPCTSEGLVAAIPTLQYIYMKAALLTPLPYEVNPKRNKLPQFSRNLISGVKRVDLSVKCSTAILKTKDYGIIPNKKTFDSGVLDRESINLISCGAHLYVREGIKERIDERKTFKSSCFIPVNGVTWDENFLYLPVSSVTSVGKRSTCVIRTGAGTSQDSGVIINGFIVRGR